MTQNMTESLHKVSEDRTAESGEIRFQVTEEQENERIDKCLTELVDFVSRSRIQKLIREQAVFVDGRPVKPSYPVKCGEEISFTLSPNEEPDIEPENLPLSILYEDEDILIVDKPKDMVVHPAAGHYRGTLVNAVMYHCGDSLSGINGVLRPGIVHRIDKDTTGSLIVCKNDRAHLSVAKQLKEHSITRVYHAICFGEIAAEEGTVDTLLGRDTNDRKKMAVVAAGGRRAVTHYKVLQRFQGYTYVECRLETGRTHQIRVHMTSLGHPLLGDTVYTQRKQPFRLKGQTLHAKTIGFCHPRTGEYMEFDAPLPEYFEKLLKTLPTK